MLKDVLEFLESVSETKPVVICGGSMSNNNSWNNSLWKVQQARTTAKPTSLWRITNTSLVLEALLDLPPLPIVVEKEAKLTAFCI